MIAPFLFIDEEIKERQESLGDKGTFTNTHMINKLQFVLYCGHTWSKFEKTL